MRIIGAVMFGLVIRESSVAGQLLPAKSRLSIFVPGQHPYRAVLGHIVSARAILAHMPNKKMLARERVKFMICKRAKEKELLESGCATKTSPPPIEFAHPLCPVFPLEFAVYCAVCSFDNVVLLVYCRCFIFPCFPVLPFSTFTAI